MKSGSSKKIPESCRIELTIGPGKGFPHRKNRSQKIEKMTQKLAQQGWNLRLISVQNAHPRFNQLKFFTQ
jgi:hypothetical protein